jgi:hypothetical protein
VADLDVVVAPEVHRDLGWAEVVVLAQVDDLAHDLGAGLVGAHPGTAGAVPRSPSRPCWSYRWRHL